MGLFLNPIDLNGNEIKNVRIHVLASAPENPSEGQVYFNNGTADAHFLAIYQNGGWNKYYVASQIDALLDEKQDNLVLDASLEFTADGKLAVKMATIAAAEATFTNKTFDANASGNSLSNVEVDDFAAGEITLKSGEAQADATLMSEAAIREAIQGADTRVDNRTIEIVGTGSSSYIQLKTGNSSDDGVKITHFNAGALQLGASEAQADAKLASKVYVDESIVSERIATATLANHTIDADSNTIANLEVDNLKAGVLQTAIRASGSATDTTIASEKAIATAIESATTALTLTGVAPITVDYSAKTVSVADATTSAVGVVQLAVAGDLSTGTDETKVLTSKITKEYIDTRLTSALIYRGAWDVNGATDYSGLEAYRPIKKGDFFAVSGGSATIEGVEYNTGDHVIFKENCASGTAVTKSMFDKIDSTESTDLVRLNAAQTLTNKTIDLDNNTVSNIEADNFKASALQLGSSESQTIETKLASKLYVDEQISGGVTRADGVTIESYKASASDPYDTFRVKDGDATNGLTVAKFNTGAVSTSIDLSQIGSDAKFPTEKAVKNAIFAEESRTATLTNKTIDVDNNTVSNIETDNFKSGVIVTSVGATGADTSIPTEKAVRSALTALDATLPHKLTVTNPALTPISGQVSWAIDHSFGNTSMSFAMIRVSDGEEVYVDHKATSTAVTITFPASADVAAGTYQVTLIG